MTNSKRSGSYPTLPENPGFFSFRKGEFAFLIVTDGHSEFTPVQRIFAPLANTQDVNKVLSKNFQAKDSIEIAYNILILKKDHEVIIFDTGCGHNFGPDAGRFTDNLMSAGIEASKVTSIFLTHAHPDHIGGLTDKDGRLIYPNASVYISNAEYEFWMSDNPDFSKCKAEEGFINMMIGIAKRNLQAAQERLCFFNDGDILFGCVKTKIVPGHTPGHAISYISTADGEMVHMGDIAHDAALLFNNPEWGVVLDTDFETAGTARRRALSNLAASRKQIFSYHLPWPGIGHIRENGQSFDWIPQAFMTP